ncbi:unnamed protein product [Cuscuta europaea]|uniref:GRF-type domain-containing protein n=1 Tax=Cuscuta europaea TaxID=41803 RepID=A0A9P0ZE94_CUSEU|nr:unnamed protein product [Cuscuta europaea]
MGDRSSPSRSAALQKSSPIDSVQCGTNIETQYGGGVRFCKCRRRTEIPVKARLWTSWTDKNPGRRFYGCPHYENDGCGFFEWHDEPLTNRAKHVINDLKMENRRLVSTIMGLEEAIRAGEAIIAGGEFEETPIPEYDHTSKQNLEFQELNHTEVAD